MDTNYVAEAANTLRFNTVTTSSNTIRTISLSVSRRPPSCATSNPTMISSPRRCTRLDKEASHVDPVPRINTLARLFFLVFLLSVSFLLKLLSWGVKLAQREFFYIA